MLHKHDIQQGEARYKFDMERDEAHRKFMAALWGVELKDAPAKTEKEPPSNGQKKVMTQQDIMRNYGR